MKKKYQVPFFTGKFRDRWFIEMAVLGDRVYPVYSMEEAGVPPETRLFDGPETWSAAESGEPGLDESRRRILHDRERLRMLLSLYYRKAPEAKKGLKAMAAAMPVEGEVHATETGGEDRDVISGQLRSIRLGKLRKVLFIIAIPFIIAALFLGGKRLYQDYREREAQRAEERRIEEEKNRVANIIQKYNVHVSDIDIFIYANQVAKKNGYAPIELGTLKKKNPHWIFPGNVFILMDGERITVVRGDTLWAISEGKLMKRHIAFYSLIEDMKKDAQDSIVDMEKLATARKLAFSKKHFEVLREMEKKK